MFLVHEIFMPRRKSLIGAAPTDLEAMALLPFKLIALEEDPSHPGHWDAIADDMRQFTIEPAK